MPGAKRRLKKAADATVSGLTGSSPGSSSPSASASESHSPIPIAMPGHPDPQQRHDASTSSAASASHAKSPIGGASGSHHLHIPFLHRHSNHDERHLSKSNSDNALDSSTSIASDPANYMSDEALKEDLEVEEMVERQQSIGSGRNHAAYGVGDLTDGMSGLTPPSGGGRVDRGVKPESMMMMNGDVPEQMAFEGRGNAVIPPPRGAVDLQMTAEEMMAGGPTGKKKSSKQKFAERQVRGESLTVFISSTGEFHLLGVGSFISLVFHADLLCYDGRILY